MKSIALFAIIILSIVFVVAAPDSAFAHKSGCHRWHSCPSDSGSYVCGDLGYGTYCPKSVEPKKEVKKQTTPSTSAECKGAALCITDKVTKIVDGDTIYLKYYKIRLSLTNTPESNQNGFKEATAFTKKLCPVGSTITVDQDDKQPFDKYNRAVGKVTCSGKVLNAELLYNGHANILTQYCAKSEFASESWAKKYGC